MFRLIYILNKLNSGIAIKTVELANEFNVTKRTVQRDLELLNIAGFPLDYSDSGHKFMDGFSLQKIAVSPEERFLINLFYRLFSKVGAPFDSVSKEFINKVLLMPKLNGHTLTNKFSYKQKNVLKDEIQQLSRSLEAKLESLSYPHVYRRKIEEFLREIEDKIIKLRKEKGVAVVFKRTGLYDQPKPVATITVPKSYFKDPYSKLDFCENEKSRMFEVLFLLPNKIFRAFRVVLKTEMFFKFWGPHLKAKKITCFDDFVAYLGFSNKEKEFHYETSYGTSNAHAEALITHAGISWEKEIPMPGGDVKPFLNKTGGLWTIADYSKKKS